MLSSLFGAVAITLGMAQPMDTTIAVRNGTRLEIEHVEGEVVVSAWNRDEVRVAASRSDLEVRSSGSVVRVRPDHNHGQNMGHRSVDLRIEVPAWMPIRIAGTQTDARVRGTRADVTIETVRGEIIVRDGAGRVLLKSVQGDIRVENARSRVEIHAANGDIVVRDVTGDVRVENVNGDIDLAGIDARSVSAGTVNGDVSYTGTIREDGRYRLTSHNGDISIAIPEDVGATISVATFSGEFHSDFPVRLDRAVPGGRFDFVIGSGRARIDLESFNGEIRLRRPRAPMGSVGRAAPGLASMHHQPEQTGRP
jgi:DUF4097 and DUF4098 domain-containing protein YvlB